MTQTDSTTIEYVRSLFPKCFDLDALKLETKRYAAMLVVNEKSYLLWTLDGKLVKHGTGFLGRNQPKICHVFLDDMAECILRNRDEAEVWSKYADLSKFPFSFFTMNFTLSKKNYNDATIYHDLSAQLKKAGVSLSFGERIRYVKSVAGFVPDFLFDGKLDYDYYKQRLVQVYARLKMIKLDKKTERRIMNLMCQSTKLLAFMR